jgi:hypothetical protein
MDMQKLIQLVAQVAAETILERHLPLTKSDAAQVQEHPDLSEDPPSASPPPDLTH